MKVKFSKSIEFRPSWGGNLDAPVGEQMVVTLKTMDNATLLGLQEAFRKDAETQSVDTKRVLAAAASILPGHCSVANLNDQNGEVTITDIATIPFYMDLSLEITMKLAEISSPTKADEKN